MNQITLERGGKAPYLSAMERSPIIDLKLQKGVEFDPFEMRVVQLFPKSQILQGVFGA